MANDSLTHDEQLIQWGFEVYSAEERVYPVEFSRVLGALEELPPDFANFRWLFEGQAITDKGLGVLYSPFFGPSPDVILALDGRLLLYIESFWLPVIGEAFGFIQSEAYALRPDAAAGVAYGHDWLAAMFNGALAEVEAAKDRAKTAGVPSLVEDGYFPAYVALPFGAILDLATVYVDIQTFVNDIRISKATGVASGLVETFMVQAEATRPKTKGPGSMVIAAIAFAGLGVAVIFAAAVAVKGKG